ncbi:hypothetical protein B0H13DRAFT_1918002 [Mycena leptocephala]|nr:hypothetical protein B0H13DRAFT_1918002 [Mycena leptocephala]
MFELCEKAPQRSSSFSNGDRQRRGGAFGASQTPVNGAREAREYETVLDSRWDPAWYVLPAEFRRRLDAFQPWTHGRHERDEIRVCVPHDEPSHSVKPAQRRHIPSGWRREECAAGCVHQDRRGRRSVGKGNVQLDQRIWVLSGRKGRDHWLGRVPRTIRRSAIDEDEVKGGYAGRVVVDEGGDAPGWDGVTLDSIAIEVAEEPLTMRVVRGVLDKFRALFGIFVLIFVVHRDGEGAAILCEVQIDVRDPSEFAYEGICTADVENVLEVGVRCDPEVAEDSGENDLQPVMADEHPTRHRLGMLTPPGVVNDELDQLKGHRDHGGVLATERRLAKHRGRHKFVTHSPLFLNFMTHPTTHRGDGTEDGIRMNDSGNDGGNATSHGCITKTKGNFEVILQY